MYGRCLVTPSFYRLPVGTRICFTSLKKLFIFWVFFRGGGGRERFICFVLFPPRSPPLSEALDLGHVQRWEIGLDVLVFPKVPKEHLRYVVSES